MILRKQEKKLKTKKKGRENIRKENQIDVSIGIFL